MKIYVGRRTSGVYELSVGTKSPKWDESRGFIQKSGYIWLYCAHYLHKYTDLRLEKGQMREFDRVKFK